MSYRDRNHPAATRAIVLPSVTAGHDASAVDRYVGALSVELAEGDVEITVVLLDEREPPTGIDRAQCERLPVTDTPPIHVPGHRVASYRLYGWLKGRAFDEVHLLEVGGTGFYAVVAKMQGLALETTKIVVHAVGPTAFVAERSGRFADDVDALEIDFMERECLRLADAVECSDPAVSQWLEAKGFELACPEAPSPGTGGVQPLVSVCVTVHDRHEFLEQAIDSVERQDYPNLEVVLVDDGSTAPALLALVERLRPKFEERGWRIIRQENLYLGAARNEAVRQARGDYVLFVDDDDVIRAELLSTLVPVAERTGADVLSTFVDFFSSAEAPGPDASEGRWIPLGGAVDAGAFRNVFGSATSLIRKATFVELGGFSEDFGVGFEDWELYARAALDGRNLQVVPEFLFWYRKLPGSMLETTPLLRNHSRVLRSYRADGTVASGILELAVGSALAKEGWSHRSAELERELEATRAELSEAKGTADALGAVVERLRRQESTDVAAVLDAAQLFAELGETTAARSALDALGRLVERVSSPGVTATVRSEGGALLSTLGDDRAAKDWSDRAVSASGDLDDAALAARVLGRCGETLDLVSEERDGARPEACVERAAAIASTIVDPVAVELRLAAGRRHRRRGNAASAWKCFTEAAAMARERGHGKLLAESLLAMAPLASSFGEAGRTDGAAMVVEAIGVARETKSARLLIHVMTEAAIVLDELGRPESESVLASAKTLALQTGNALAAVKLERHAPERENLKETLA